MKPDRNLPEKDIYNIIRQMKAGKILNNIIIILVEPKNPGNIGSVVRAMKNMGVSKLRLINPVDYRNADEQRKLGYRSQEIIEASREYKTLKDAVSDVSTVFLATTRKGKWKKDFVTPKDAAKLVAERSSKEKVALVFGREDSGVTIDESQFANYFINIPAAIKYPSLNLSQSVMVLVYEIYSGIIEGEINPVYPKRAKNKSYERLYENILDLMKNIEFHEEKKGLFYRSLKRALNRTHWTNADIAVFDRTCKQVRWYLDNSPKLRKEK